MSGTGRRARAHTTEAFKRSGTAAPAARAPKRPATGAPTLRERVRYAFDATMARGAIALVGWLAVATLLLIAAFSAIVLLTGTNSGHSTIPGQLFYSLLHALDPGTVAGDAGSWGFLLTMLVLTIAGLFIVSALIGVIATGIDARLMQLRKGRSRVLERDHTLILGFSDSVFTIIRELVVANESRRRPAVVVLAERDKVEMEDAIREKAGDLRNTRVVCRSGSPIDLDDLEIVGHRTARSIIVLSPEGDDPDSEVIKTILALTRGPRRRADRYHIVAEIRDPRNLEAARLVGGEEAVVLDKRETIARLIVQSARQSGASVVYTELFDFDGDEVYFDERHGLSGSTYGEALLAYEDCAVMGLAGPGGVRLNPPPETRINGHAIVAIAEDDSRLRAAIPPGVAVDESAIVAAPPRPAPPSRALVIGWNDRGPLIATELDAYMAAGSELLIVAEYGDLAVPELRNAAVAVRHERTTDRAVLEALDVARFDEVIVLCYADDLDAQRADARTLVTLLHLRDILADVPPQARPTIVSEILDERDRALAQVAEVDDVIVSDRIISLVLAQLSENPRLDAVFADLLDADGAEIYLRPAGEYVALGRELSFATLVEAARRRGETALGFRQCEGAQDVAAAYGVRVNPAKSLPIVVQPGDRVIVLAED